MKIMGLAKRLLQLATAEIRADFRSIPELPHLLTSATISTLIFVAIMKGIGVVFPEYSSSLSGDSFEHHFARSLAAAVIVAGCGFFAFIWPGVRSAR